MLCLPRGVVLQLSCSARGVPLGASKLALLVWDTKGANGMGDLLIPWKPSHQEIYVLGDGFRGRRDNDVIVCAPVQSMATRGRVHPHQKPVALLERLLDKCPPGVVAYPFAGSGSTLVAARNLGRRVIGVEIEERYCEIAARRLDQLCLDLEDALLKHPGFDAHRISCDQCASRSGRERSP